MDKCYDRFKNSLPDGVDLERARRKLLEQEIETPSWGYADSGTRFQCSISRGLPGLCLRS